MPRSYRKSEDRLHFCPPAEANWPYAVLPSVAVVKIREADIPRDLDAVGRLWFEYLTWGNDELESRYGFRLPVQETVEGDLATVAKFRPPDGRLLLAFEDGAAVGTACMRRIGPETAEIKRMYVQPTHRGAGLGARCSTS